MRFHALEPGGRDLDADALAGELELGARASDERPYVVANFAATADGRATIGGRSGPIGDEGDRELFHALRTSVDAILVGTGTLAAERYGPLSRDERRRTTRTAAGLSPDPLGCVVSRSGSVPWDVPLFADGGSRVIVFSSVEVAPPRGVAADVAVVVLDPGELTLTSVLRRLRSEHGVRALLCEGGPTLFASLLDERLVDELFLTLAPKLAGGGLAPAITAGAALADPVALELVWALERAGALYLRYRLPAAS